MLFNNVISRPYDPLFLNSASFSTSVAWPVMLNLGSKISGPVAPILRAAGLIVDPENVQKIVAISIFRKL